MNKLIAAIISILVFGIASSVGAWSITEYVEHVGGDIICDDGGCWTTDEWTTVNFNIDNNSTQSIVGFGVGINEDMDPNYRYSEAFAPNNQEINIGDWNANIVQDMDWDISGIIGPSGPVTYANYFGTTWDETFGDYHYAYLATPDFTDPPTAPGSFAPGEEWTESWGFIYVYSEWGIEYSPAIVLFDQSGASFGETDFDNPNPVPVPCTMLLMGSGLAGLIGLRKRRAKK